MKNVQAVYLKERCELLLEQIEECKKDGKTDTKAYLDLQKSYIRNSGVYIAVMGAMNKQKMKELGIESPKNPKPLTDEKLASLGLSEETMKVLKDIRASVV